MKIIKAIFSLICGLFVGLAIYHLPYNLKSAFGFGILAYYIIYTTWEIK